MHRSVGTRDLAAAAARKRCRWDCVSPPPEDSHGFQFVSGDAAQAWVNCYYNSITKRLDKLCEYPTNPNLALVSNFMCAPTDEEALARAERATFFAFALQFYARHGVIEPGSVNLWEEYQVFRKTPKGEKRHRARGLSGSPETIRRRLRKFEESHVDQVILLNQAGKTASCRYHG